MNCPNCHCPRGEPLTVAVNSLVTRCHHAFHAVATAEAPPLNEPFHPQSPVTPDDFVQQKPAQDATAHVWCPVNGMGGCAHAGECVGVVCLAHDRKERPKDFPYTTPAMACPTCNDAPGAAPFCSNGYHLAPIQPPYTTPVPTLHDGSTGWVYCEACDAPQPVAGHECREILLPDELKRLRALLHEARRLVCFSAKDLREREGEDSVLCELVEEEQFVKDATDLLGPMPEAYE